MISNESLSRTEESDPTECKELGKDQVEHDCKIVFMAYVYSKVLRDNISEEELQMCHNWLNTNAISPEGEYQLDFDDWTEVMAFEEEEIKRLNEQRKRNTTR